MARSKGKASPNLLTMVPARAERWSVTAAGTVDIEVPRYGHHRVGRWLARRLRASDIKIHLDPLGSAAWQACDGRSTVGEIGEQLHAAFGDRIEPVYDRLATFFQHLERERFIRWADPGGPPA